MQVKENSFTADSRTGPTESSVVYTVDIKLSSILLYSKWKLLKVLNLPKENSKQGSEWISISHYHALSTMLSDLICKNKHGVFSTFREFIIKMTKGKCKWSSIKDWFCIYKNREVVCKTHKCFRSWRNKPKKVGSSGEVSNKKQNLSVNLE